MKRKYQEIISDEESSSEDEVTVTNYQVRITISFVRNWLTLLIMTINQNFIQMLQVSYTLLNNTIE